MNSRIYAAIDVGSNSVRLLVARADEDRLTVLRTARTTTRLINGVKDGLLTGEPAQCTALAIAEQVQIARELGAAEIHAFGTSALRDAKNGEAFCEQTEALCGVRIRIISGVEEAQLAFSGAAPSGSCGVVDIGGGSTELIVGADGQMLRAHSAQIGAVRLANELNGRLDPGEMLEMAARRVEETARIVCTASPDKWIGVGGTITSLAAMTKQVDKYTPDAINDFPLTQAVVEDWLQRLCKMPVDERRTLIGLTPQRADIIPYGAAILLAVMRRTDAARIHACDHDNLEGYIRRNML